MLAIAQRILPGPRLRDVFVNQCTPRSVKVYKVDSMPNTTPLGELEQLVLLAILRLGSEAYGLSVARELEREAGRRLSRGALYTTLDRLELKGLVRWKPEPGGAERRGLPRRIYTVTARGVAALRTTRRVLHRMWQGLDALLKGPSS
jgi:PadR family transcriptional regulator, regulatory protein PadR